MESKIVPNLFFAGEVVDVDGDCGGYNLQWAWASGFAAGTAAAVVPPCSD
jgi:predicted flavoprotein YhiN